MAPSGSRPPGPFKPSRRPRDSAPPEPGTDARGGASGWGSSAAASGSASPSGPRQATVSSAELSSTASPRGRAPSHRAPPAPPRRGAERQDIEPSGPAHRTGSPAPAPAALFIHVAEAAQGEGQPKAGAAYPPRAGCPGDTAAPTARGQRARRMFEGEMASLEALLKTQTIKVPKPIKVIDLPGGTTLFVMEHLEMKGLNRHSGKLGQQLADLHLHNQKIGERLKKEGNTVGKSQGETDVQFVDQFGFNTVTCCGYLPQVNDWQNDWVTFFATQRIQPQMDMIEKNSGDREARELWAQLQLKIPSLFCDMEIIPALLHGDLWGGNVAEDDSGPIIFDPASFYGHSEYELAIAGMFGGFNSSFYSAYHSKIPKAPGFEKRLKLYQLFHYMNHWNHFGTGYRGSSLSIMRNLVK
ncbi:ketosamine-3-kinase isoform X2 [Alligator mississippiensis]|uniref:ketosamine-3-kinase isoform X2 n=1 Tax=Alligator mississippiensis TaxID=8496 RepID=UPI0028776832|nr:ketosamine-3-kinase isoform X2 [Alligator mississippiensis]